MTQTPNGRKLPLRKCTVCGSMIPKKELLRVILTPEGEIIPDITGKQNGRGAYLCKNPECLQNAKKQKALERSLKVKIPEEVYEKITEAMKSLG